MNWQDIVKEDRTDGARFVPRGKKYDERLDNLIYFVNQNFPELKENMIQFEKEWGRIVQENTEEYEKDGNNNKAIRELIGLSNLFTRKNGVRGAYLDIINSID